MLLLPQQGHTDVTSVSSLETLYTES